MTEKKVSHNILLVISEDISGHSDTEKLNGKQLLFL